MEGGILRQWDSSKDNVAVAAKPKNLPPQPEVNGDSSEGHVIQHRSLGGLKHSMFIQVSHERVATETECKALLIGSELLSLCALFFSTLTAVSLRRKMIKGESSHTCLSMLGSFAEGRESNFHGSVG